MSPPPAALFSSQTNSGLPWRWMSLPTAVRRQFGGKVLCHLSHSLKMTIPGDWNPRAIRTVVHNSSSSPSGFWKRKINYSKANPQDESCNF